MHHKKCTLDEAIRWATTYHGGAQARFLDTMKQVPSFGAQVDPQLRKYICSIAVWARANYCWSFESGRYFGDKGQEMQTTRVVPLVAKECDK